jgi:hypothetical protein
MAKPSSSVTPDNRVDRWKKMWGTPRKLDPEETEIAFDEFAQAVVPGHMHKMFLKNFGVPKAQFGNRYFGEETSFQNWDTRLSSLLGEGDHLEAIVIYASPEKIEAHWLRGERRRTLRDIVIDDWHAACAIVKAGSSRLNLFIEPKMRGCIIRIVQVGDDEEPS